YCDDIYDRIWSAPSVKVGLVINVKSDAIISNNVADNLPQAVLQKAVTTSPTSARILLIHEVSSGEVPIYLNLYFSECKILICRDLSSFGLSGLLPDFSSMDAIETMVTGNPNLCASGKSCETSDTPISSNIPSTSNSVSKKKKNKLPVILGTTIPSSLVVLAIAGALAMLHHKRKKASVAAVGTVGSTGMF
ncbi:hypothetical protein RJ640_016190, partial [Escallonia rubra]